MTFFSALMAPRGWYFGGPGMKWLAIRHRRHRTSAIPARPSADTDLQCGAGWFVGTTVWACGRDLADIVVLAPQRRSSYRTAPRFLAGIVKWSIALLLFLAVLSISQRVGRRGGVDAPSRVAADSVGADSIWIPCDRAAGLPVPGMVRRILVAEPAASLFFALLRASRTSMGLLVLEHDVAAGVGLHQTLSAVRSIGAPQG